MKKNLLLLLLIISPFILSSCERSNFDETEAIIGNWESTNSDLGCEFDETSYGQGYVYTSQDGGSIETLLGRYTSDTWIFNQDTHIRYQINPQSYKIVFYLYNKDSVTGEIYNQDTVYLTYVFEDYNHLVLDGQVEFERYNSGY